jgi:surfactin synthase thioesterase subunit
MFPGDHFYIHTSTDLLHALRRDVFDLLQESPLIATRGNN